jgi:putative FmdB family regulatory protein
MGCQPGNEQETMPLYEYQCDGCGHRFEVIQKYSDPPVSACPSCGESVKKLLSSPAIQFKGTGWYITDYARKGSQTGDGAEAPSSTAKSDKSEPAKSSTDTSSTTTTSTTPSSGGSGSGGDS